MKQGRGVRFSVSPGFLLTAALLYYLDGTVVLWAGAMAVLHELGHFGAIALLGGRTARISLTAIGAAMELDGSRPLSYPKEFLAALSGPMVSIFVAWLAAKWGAFLPAGLSLALGVFNLLPVGQLDGGRCLYALIAWRQGPEVGETVLRRASQLTVAVVLGGAVGILKVYGNFTLLMVALWLLAGLKQVKTAEKMDVKAKQRCRI